MIEKRVMSAKRRRDRCPRRLPGAILPGRRNRFAAPRVRQGERRDGTRTWKPLDERTLVQRVKDGDPSAERELYDAHVDRVYGLAFRMTGDETLARDLTQDAFVRAFDRIDSYRGDAALSTWLHTVTTSVVLNGLRKVKRIREREADLDDARGAAIVERRSEPDLRDRLHAAISGLPDGYRKVFLMHDVEGYTHQEIARALGVAEGTSKAQLSRARAKLRVELADYAEEWVA